VLCLGDRFRSEFVRRRACKLDRSRVPKASLANLQGKAPVQRELIHSLVRSILTNWS